MANEIVEIDFDKRTVKMSADIIGGFDYSVPECKGCGKPLVIENAWMTDGCPCNSRLGVNNFNETRWRLLMQLQQEQSHRIEELESSLSAIIGTYPQRVMMKPHIDKAVELLNPIKDGAK